MMRGSKGVIGRPLVEYLAEGLDEILLGKAPLLDGQLAALFTVVHDARQRVVLVLQARLIELACRRVGVIDLGAVNLLKRLHGADGADQFEVGVIGQQVAGEIERQWRHAMGRHEVAHLQAHLGEVEIRERRLVVDVLDAQHGVAIFLLAIHLAVRHAQADDRRLAERCAVGVGVNETLEQLAVEVAKPFRDAKLRALLIVLGQPHAEVVVANIGREVVPHHAFDALVEMLIDDGRLQHFNRGESIARVCHVQLAGDDLQLDGIAIRPGVIPVCQGIEAVVDHGQRIAQVFLAALPSRQIGEVGRGTRALGRTVVFVEPDALDIEGKVVAHREQTPCWSRLATAPQCSSALDAMCDISIHGRQRHVIEEDVFFMPDPPYE